MQVGVNTRPVERLVLLLDAAQGLMARLHAMLTFGRPAVLNREIEDVTEHLVKKFPAYPVGTEKVCACVCVCACVQACGSGEMPAEAR
jgi:hypothetical protein